METFPAEKTGLLEKRPVTWSSGRFFIDRDIVQGLWFKGVSLAHMVISRNDKM